MKMMLSLALKSSKVQMMLLAALLLVSYILYSKGYL